MLKVALYNITPGKIEEINSCSWFPPEERKWKIYRRMIEKAYEVYKEEMSKTDEEWEKEEKKERLEKEEKINSLDKLFG